MLARRLITQAIRLQTSKLKYSSLEHTISANNALYRKFHEPGNGSQPPLTMAEVKDRIFTRLGLSQAYDPNPPVRDHLTKYEPKIEELPPRTMQDSFTSAIIPLSTNLELRDKYTAFLGRLRLGRLLEDMDIFACWVCHQHLYIPKLDPEIHLPYTFVTISVDRIDFTDVVAKVDEDIRISGHISWVGRSSMEIVVWLEQKIENEWKKITRALFLFAARNATNTKAAPVNPIRPGNDYEQNILSGGEARRQNRILLQEQSLFRVEPNDEEQRHIHEIFMTTVDEDDDMMHPPHLPPHSVWLSDTELNNIILTHPENRNAHNKVFGGYLMRQALEMGFSCAYMFTKTRPKLKHISDIAFKKPVTVSSFINMKAHVIYTEGNQMQIVCVANIFDCITGEQFTTNLFYFTFSLDAKCPAIVPKTYHEAMWYLKGKRIFKSITKTNSKH